MTDPEAPTETGLTRVTVNLTPRAMDALVALGEATGLGKTDVINRAVQVYRLVDDLARQDGGFRIVRPDGALERIHVL